MPARFPRFRLNRKLQAMLLTAVVLVALAALCDRIVMPLYTRQGWERPVPRFVGLTLSEAKLRADSAGFTLVLESPKLGGNVPEGTILEQHPFAGALAKPGRKIRVVPAMAAPRDVAPDLIGLEFRDAQLRCKNVGLVCTENDAQFRFSDRVPKGLILAQSPEAGKPVDKGTSVKVTISLGPQPAHFFVPYLMEKPVSEARVILREAGLRLGKIVRKETDLYPAGTVIAQSVRSGTEVERDTPIDLVVAVAKKQSEPAPEKAP